VDSPRRRSRIPLSPSRSATMTSVRPTSRPRRRIPRGANARVPSVPASKRSAHLDAAPRTPARPAPRLPRPTAARPSSPRHACSLRRSPLPPIPTLPLSLLSPRISAGAPLLGPALDLPPLLHRRARSPTRPPSAAVHRAPASALGHPRAPPRRGRPSASRAPSPHPSACTGRLPSSDIPLGVGNHGIRLRADSGASCARWTEPLGARNLRPAKAHSIA